MIITMWLHSALIVLGLQGLCGLQVVVDMNEIMLETAGEALELAESSTTGAVTPPGKTSSEFDQRQVPRAHRKTPTKPGTYLIEGPGLFCPCIQYLIMLAIIEF